MENTELCNIKFTKISEDGKYYLIVEVGGFNALSLFAYQIDMIAENPHKSIITPEIRRKDDVIVFYYDITDKKPLNECMENNLLNFRQFKEITTNILYAIKYGQGLLLYKNNFLLKYDHIYMDDSCGIPSIIYLPFNIENSYLNIENNFQKQFKELVLYICGRMAVESNVQEKKAFKEITEYVKNNEFIVDKYLELLEKCETKEKITQENLIYTNDKYANDVSCRVSTGPEANGEKEDSEIKTLTIALDSIILGYKLSTLLTALLVQIIIIASAFFIERYSFLNNAKPLIKYGIIAGFILFADILLYIFVFLRDKRRDSCMKEKKEESLPCNHISEDCNDIEESFKSFASNGSIQDYDNILLDHQDVEDVEDVSLIHNEGALKHDSSLSDHEGVSLVKSISLIDNASPMIHHNASPATHYNASPLVYDSSLLVPDGGLMINNEKLPDENNKVKHEDECTNISPYDETSFLFKPQKPLGFFISCKDGNSERHEIKSENCIVGRNHHVCDFVISQKTIGRVHAQIVCKEGEVLLYDKNSKNGTFINGAKLEPEEGYVLSDGDIIMFADVEYKYFKNF